MALDRDPRSMSTQSLSKAAMDANHPLHMHAKVELQRRRMQEKSAEIDEVSLAALKKQVSNSTGTKNIKKAMNSDQLKKDLAKMRAKLATEAKDPEEYDKEGEMMKSQLRQICSANEKLMQMVGDDDNLPEWVQSKVTKATDYIRSVRDYLESEKMDESVNETKAAPKGYHFTKSGQLKKGDADVDGPGGKKLRADPLDKQRSKIPPLPEKTLTSAEKKKREEIAKAMERENPGMPMDKKMAIATATAKRVAEQASLNEDRRSELYHNNMSFHHAMMYAQLRKKDPKASKHHDMAGKLHAKAADMYADNHKDAKKHADKANKASKLLGEGLVNETADLLQELKKSTLKSYIKKASKDAADRGMDAVDKAKSGDTVGFGKQFVKSRDRVKNIAKAVDKLEDTKPDAVEVMRKKQQMANISTSDKDKLAKIRAMLDRERKK